MLPMMLAGLAFWITVLGGGFYLIRRYVRAVERKGVESLEVAELRARLLAVEESVEQARSDVERLEAAQEFTSRLLSQRTRSVEPAG